jgi:small subunit ribosomal protein S20
MNKKQRNRKAIKKIKRNRMINKRYSSTVKTLLKYFSNKIKIINDTETISSSSTLNGENFDQNQIKEKKKQEIFTILKNLYSMIDKATKKSVIHKNTAARKKSRIANLYSSI